VFGLARFKNEAYQLYLACVIRLAHFKNEEYTYCIHLALLGSHSLCKHKWHKNEEYKLYLACVWARFNKEEYTLYLVCVWARTL